MQGHWVSFGFGFVTGLRSMTAGAALSWAASMGKTQLTWIPSSSRARTIAAVAALGEMVVDKTPLAPDRRIAPSMLLRLGIGATGGAALAGREASLLGGALSGMAGAVVGVLVGSTARSGTTRPGEDWPRALTEDAVAAALAATLVYLAEPRRTPTRG